VVKHCGECVVRVQVVGDTPEMAFVTDISGLCSAGCTPQTCGVMHEQASRCYAWQHDVCKHICTILMQQLLG